jgi:hypothetical protein
MPQCAFAHCVSGAIATKSLKFPVDLSLEYLMGMTARWRGVLSTAHRVGTLLVAAPGMF